MVGVGDPVETGNGMRRDDHVTLAPYSTCLFCACAGLDELPDEQMAERLWPGESWTRRGFEFQMSPHLRLPVLVGEGKVAAMLRRSCRNCTPSYHMSLTLPCPSVAGLLEMMDDYDEEMEGEEEDDYEDGEELEEEA